MATYVVPYDTYENFRNAVNGHGYDIDGYYGYQCWDGVALLYQQLGRTLWTTNTGGGGVAKGCWLNEGARSHNSGSGISLVYNANNLKQGDMVVLDTNSGAGTTVGTAGHIAFVDAVIVGGDYGTLRLLGQNQGAGSNPDTGKPFNLVNFTLNGNFLGAFRYDAWNQPIPPHPTTSKKRQFPFAVAWHHWGNFKK